MHHNPLKQQDWRGEDTNVKSWEAQSIWIYVIAFAALASTLKAPLFGCVLLCEFRNAVIHFGASSGDEEMERAYSLAAASCRPGIDCLQQRQGVLNFQKPGRGRLAIDCGRWSGWGGTFQGQHLQGETAS